AVRRLAALGLTMMVEQGVDERGGVCCLGQRAERLAECLILPRRLELRFGVLERAADIARCGLDRVEPGELGRCDRVRVARGVVAVTVCFAERVAAAVGREELEHLRAGVVLGRDERAPEELAFAAAGAERAEVIEEEAPAAPARAARNLAAGEAVRDGGGEVA